jgi:chitodextrinase
MSQPALRSSLRVSILSTVIFAFLISTLPVRPGAAFQTAAWAPNTSYSIGTQVTFQGGTYECRQAHTSQPGWEPTNAPALWLLLTGGGGGGDTQPPTAPSNLRATATTSSSISLAWNASTDNVGVTGYDVLRANIVIGSTAGTSFTADGLASSTTFAFTVRAKDAAGNISAVSNSISATTQAASGGGGQVVAWAPNIFFAVGAQATFQGSTFQCRQAHTSQIGWEPTNAPALWLLVGAGGGGGGGGSDTQAPTAPTNVRVTGSTSSSVSLAWNASTDNVGVTGYDVFQGMTLVGGTTATSFTVTGLSASTTFVFTVKAKDAAGNISVASSSASGTTQSGGGGGGGNIPGRVFVPYADLGLFPTLNMAQTAGASGTRFFTMAFIIDDNTQDCVASWFGGIRVMNDPTQPNFLLDDINALRGQGGNVIPSFGGAAGDELAMHCSSASAAQAQYQSVITKYGVTHLDFDIEGPALDNTTANSIRNQAIAALQRANPGLNISFTLPVLPSGLLNNSLNMLKDALAKGVNINIVNIMAFDYGPQPLGGRTMSQAAIDAVNSTAEQLGQAGLFPTLTVAQRRAKIGVTLMTNVDDLGEVTSVGDAQTVTSRAIADGWGRLSIWNANRDRPGFQFMTTMNQFTR